MWHLEPIFIFVSSQDDIIFYVLFLSRKKIYIHMKYELLFKYI